MDNKKKKRYIQATNIANKLIIEYGGHNEKLEKLLDKCFINENDKMEWFRIFAGC